MKRFISCLVALLLFIQITFAVTVDKDNRVPNRPDGYCVWCCVDMVARQFGHKTLIGITDRKEQEKVWNGREWVKADGGADMGMLVNELKQHQIKYWVQWPGDRNTDILSKAKAADLPVIFGTKGYPVQGYAHAMLLVDYDKETVKFIDPNDASRIYSGSWEWFFYYWDGYTAVIERPESKVVNNGTKSFSYVSTKSD